MSSKRFIDNSILPKAFRKLKPSLKIAWYYIWNSCDKSGVWEIDSDLFEFENQNCEFDLEGFKKEFSDLIQVKDDKILLKDFIRINFGKLTENYNPHKPVFRDLERNKVKLNPSLNQAYFKLVYEEEDVYEEEKGKRGVGKKPKEEKQVDLNYPYDTETFKAQWKLWKLFKKKKFKFSYLNEDSENRVLEQLKNLSKGSEKEAINIIQQSIDNGWKGLFELKDKPKPKKQTASKAWREKLGV